MNEPLRNKPATNTAAVVTIAAEIGVIIELDSIHWSYSGGTPSGGNLKVESPSGTTIFELDLPATATCDRVYFPSGLRGASPNTTTGAGAALIVTLAAAGSGIQGILDIIRRY